jgi:mannosyl-oligosaccharide alpha-1,2-mannosidase
VDSLDALYILGMEIEFEEALKSLELIDFSMPSGEPVAVFEVTIRCLGGLLGAWDISDHKYPIFLEKATQLGDLLYKAFNTPSGLPVPYYDWQHQGPEKLVGERGVIIAQIRSECDVGGL